MKGSVHTPFKPTTFMNVPSVQSKPLQVFMEELPRWSISPYIILMHYYDEIIFLWVCRSLHLRRFQSQRYPYQCSWSNSLAPISPFELMRAFCHQLNLIFGRHNHLGFQLSVSMNRNEAYWRNQIVLENFSFFSTPHWTKNAGLLDSLSIFHLFWLEDEELDPSQI